MINSGDLILSHTRYMKAAGRRPRTIESRLSCLHRFEALCGKGLRDATRDDVEDYIEAQRAVATKRVYLAHLRAFYRWALDESLIDHDPTRRVVAPVVKRGVPRPISEAELARAIGTATPMIRAWMMLAAYAGLRACEIALVCGEHVVRGENPYLILPETKGGGAATVPLADVLLVELAKWPPTGPLWKPDGPMHYQVVSRKVNKHLREQGIRCGLHALRHRFGTQAYMSSGHDLRQTQELLRHASPATTAVYTQLDPRRGSAVVNNLPVPPEAA
jgi:integrase/recombinase XerC